MALNKQTFFTRTASAAVFVVLLIGSILFNQISFIIFFGLVGMVGLFEFFKLSKITGHRPYAALGYAFHVFSIYSCILFFERVRDFYSSPFLLLVILAGPLYMLVELFKKKSSIFNVPGFITSFLYVTIPCLLLMLMTFPKVGTASGETTYFPHVVLGMIFFIWINDTGAYLVGSFLGKHKLYERISPGKTWEGTIGGVILCIALSFLMVRIFPELELKHWIAISVLVAVFGTLGDLVESMLKRIAGVKDSGNIMPGHGGVLDRFDSIFFATPFVFAYLVATGNL